VTAKPHAVDSAQQQVRRLFPDLDFAEEERGGAGDRVLITGSVTERPVTAGGRQRRLPSSSAGAVAGAPEPQRQNVDSRGLAADPMRRTVSCRATQVAGPSPSRSSRTRNSGRGRDGTRSREGSS
jgi:hypothetical protein